MSKKRTNGRAMNRLQAGIAGMALRTAYRASTEFGDQLALRLFCTPGDTRSRRTQRMPADAHLEYLEFENEELAVYSAGDGPVVLLAHGWTGTADDLGFFAGVLRRAGFRAVLLDMPAHGRSSGSRTDLMQMSRALHAVAGMQDNGAIHGVVGHSLGAAAAMLAMRNGLAVNRAVLVAPPAGADRYMDRMARMLRLPDHARMSAVRSLEKLVGGDLSLTRATNVARELSVPALIVHDEDDQDVRWEEGLAVAEAWSRSRLLTTRGMGHRRLLGNGDVLSEMLSFIQASRDVTDVSRASGTGGRFIASANPGSGDLNERIEEARGDTPDAAAIRTRAVS
jgi:pimeloyl-ACP methyl ester carboxylesterase